MRGKTRKTRWTQRQGGGWANDLYHATKAPDLRHCGRANKRGIHGDAYRIKTAQGPYCSHNELGWVEITFETEASNLVDTKFCPDPRYSEFNGAACSDNDNTDSCQRSVKKGFESDKSKCINLYKVSHYNYDNKEFYTLISNAIERNSKYNKSGIQNKFVDASIELLKMACSIKSISGDVTFEDEEKCEKRIEEMFVKGKETHRFFGLINEASKLCKNPKIGNPSLCSGFKDKLKDVIRYARRINFNANEKQFSCSCPSDIYSRNYKIIKANHECKSKDQWLGWKRSIKDCAEACNSKKGCKYFIYGKGKKKGRCYWEKTKTDNCSEGWERDLYDFAKVDKRKCGPC